MRLHSINRPLTITTLIFAVFAFLATVIFSPFGLRALANSSDLNWTRLSNVGQTYGAISALITALAFGGVVISLWYQAREVSATRAQAISSFQFNLLRMELEDEGHMWASGAPWGYAIPADYRGLRQHVFVHMWLSFWQSQFVLKEMSGESVRGAAKELFYGKAGREYWNNVGQSRLEVNKGRDLEYLQIVDEEYWKALKNGPPVTSEGGSAQQIGPAGVRTANAAEMFAQDADAPNIAIRGNLNAHISRKMPAYAADTPQRWQWRALPRLRRALRYAGCLAGKLRPAETLEFSIVHAADKGMPFVRSELQHRSLGVPAVTDADPATGQARHLDAVACGETQ